MIVTRVCVILYNCEYVPSLLHHGPAGLSLPGRGTLRSASP
jgi:hypothetical protein